MPESHFTSEVYALYVIGSLDGEDFRDFESHLHQGCDTCRGELLQARDLWTAYGAATPPATPRPELRQRILTAALRASPIVMPTRRPVRSVAWWQQAIAAAVILAAGIALGWYLRKPAPAPRVAEVLTPAPPAPAPVPAPTPTPSPAAVPEISRAEEENRALRARIAELDKTIAAQQSQLQASAATSKDAANLQQELVRARADADAQARQLQGQVTAAETRAREAEQRSQTAENDRRQAVDREARLRETTAARIRQLEGENEKFRRVIDDQQRRIQQNLQLASFFSSPNLRFYQYQGTRNGPGAKAHVVAQEGSKVMFYAFNLPRLPAGRTYQLWIIRGQSPAIVSGGIFQPDQNGNAVVQFSDASMLRDVRQFAVTDEPEGGSRGPTGKQFLRAAS